MRAAYLAAAVLLVLAPERSHTQQLPFAVTIVDWDPNALEGQQRAYRFDAGRPEVLYCVESWRRVAADSGIERIVITKVRPEHIGQRRAIDDVGKRCIAANGTRLPTIHTHTEGNCQFSPSDLITVGGRSAPFDGVQCGDRHFAWAFAWQIVALSVSVEQERVRQGRAASP